ncbi:MAG TPA: AAA family ATPase [Nitrososphaeraceae archaeon]
MNLFKSWKRRSHQKFELDQNFVSNKTNNLFYDIIGYSDIKELFDMSINAQKPVHILLCGPPASAKSIFMTCLTKLERSYYAVGSSSTKSGIFDYLFENRPRFFIIDEIEKMNKKDQVSLLNLMESGILSELKHNHARSTQLKTWVFASANSMEKLLYPLVTRFTVINVKPYTEDEFVDITIQLLEKEGIDRDVAVIIADAVFNRLKTSNIRDCIRIARLVGGNDVSKTQRVINIFERYNQV